MNKTQWVKTEFENGFRLENENNELIVCECIGRGEGMVKLFTVYAETSNGESRKFDNSRDAKKFIEESR